jgi:hypothetical protein
MFIPKLASFGKKLDHLKMWIWMYNKGTLLLKCHPNVKQTSTTSGKKFLQHGLNAFDQW